MSVFTSAASWLALFAQDTPRSYGVLMSLEDPVASKLSVQIGIPNTAQGVWDSPGALWNSASWDDDNFATWVDITARVRELSWDRGTTDPLTQPEVGTAQIVLDNSDGAVSPWATTGPFTNPVTGEVIWDSGAWDVEAPGSGASLLRAGVPVRFGVTQDSGPDIDWCPFFTGLIETVDEDTDSNVDAWVTLSLVDVTGKLANYGHGTNELALPGVGETVADLWQQLLQDIAWPYDSFSSIPAHDTYFDHPKVSLPNITQNRLAALQLLATSGMAFLIADTAGTLEMYNRGGANETPFYTLSNDPTGEELPVITLTPYSSTDRILNSVAGTRAAQSDVDVPETQIAEDADSIAAFGVHGTGLGWPIDDLMLASDTDVLALVQAVVAAQANDYQGISSIDMDADLDPTRLFWRMSIFAAFGLEQAIQLAVRWVHPSGNVYSTNVRVAGFSHHITMEGAQAKWTATLRTTKV